ncbi:MAG TPA: TetR family transcriptional regulator, partial [Thermoleophilaceae bacterium]
MEAAQATERAERRLDSEKAKRIVAAMRASVARRGAAGSTFDHVAQEAGVSRGLLHYYFGSKERLLVEVVRHDAWLRIQELEDRLRDADTLDAVIEALVVQLRELVEQDDVTHAVIHELLSAARQNDEIRDELGEHYRRLRGRVGEILREKEADGVVALRAEPEAAAAVLLAIADGFEVQTTIDDDWDSAPTVAAAVAAARHLLGA